MKKDIVNIREREMTGGGKSLHLDYYYHGKRFRENLKLYLVPEKTRADRMRNEETMQLANTVKAKRMVEIQNDNLGLKVFNPDSGITLVDYIDKIMSRYKADGKSVVAINNVKMSFVQLYPTLKLSKITEQIVIDWLDNLKSKHKYVYNPKVKKKGANQIRRLKSTTINSYYNVLHTILAYAVEDDLLQKLPLTKKVKSHLPKVQQHNKEFLTLSDLNRMCEVKMPPHGIGQAFLFACFTGLRISDIKLLKWGNIIDDNGRKSIQIRPKKVKCEVIYIPISNNAQAWLPAAKAPDELVYPDLPSIFCLNYQLARWVERAGINKHITTHCARHTAATMLLTYGADIYTVSKILGHHDIRNTQIYAKVVDSKKVEAVNLIPELKTK